MVQMNKKRLLTQNRKPSQSQRKPRRRSKLRNIRNSSSNNRELRKISKQLNSRKKLIYHRQYTPKLGICKIKQTKKDPRYLIKLMKQCIKGNHHQAMPIQRNNLPCKPKEITSKEKLRSENQYLEIKLANQVKLADDSVRTLLGLY
ncbi:Hypothetical_protein [Hexamita inflata]|uniref:Hypothetical_protein n=1 Tax=Hexamita inflata TaxID=28002 RepID=A0ABP1HGQ7_9EUKA